MIPHPAPRTLTPAQAHALQVAVCPCGENDRIAAERRGFTVVLICRRCGREWVTKPPSPARRDGVV